MAASEYIRGLREQIGNDYLLLPGVTAVIQDGDKFLLARHRDSGRWSLVGGGVEPGEEPQAALVREVLEELGVEVAVTGIVGAYGGPALESVYPNGDAVGYITVAYRCLLSTSIFSLERTEILETRWVASRDVQKLDRHEWVDMVLRDAAR